MGRDLASGKGLSQEEPSLDGFQERDFSTTRLKGKTRRSGSGKVDRAAV
jgi:hypothetical protein